MQFQLHVPVWVTGALHFESMRWEKEKLREIKELEASLDFPLGKWGPLGWKISLYRWATTLSLPLKSLPIRTTHPLHQIRLFEEASWSWLSLTLSLRLPFSPFGSLPLGARSRYVCGTHVTTSSRTTRPSNSFSVSPKEFELVLNLFGVLWEKQGSSSFSSLLQAIFRRFLLQLAVTNLSKGPWVSLLGSHGKYAHFWLDRS
jgi:hypothetical protein